MTISATQDTYTSDEAVSIDTRSLISLAHSAQNIPLQHAGVRASQSGAYLSPFKGRGMEFDEIRPYQAGDDIRNMDWKVTARTGKAHTKLYREERERPVLLWVDLRASMFFATRGAYKSVIASRIATLLAWSAIAHGDRVGGLLFSEPDSPENVEKAHKELRPQRGKGAVLRFINELVHHSAWQHKQTAQQATQSDNDITQTALSRLRNVARPGSLIFLISDFIHLNTAKTQAHLNQLARHNDIVLINISDPIEQELPPAGWYRISDGKQEIDLNTHDNTFRENYHSHFQAHEAYLQQLCQRYRMHYIPCATNKPLVHTLQQGLGLKFK